MIVSETRARRKVINGKEGPPHPGTNTVLRTPTLTPVVKGKTIGSKKEQREKNTFYVLYSKRNWFHRTFIFIQPFHLHRDPNLNSVILLRAASQRIPGRSFLMMMKGTAPPCGNIVFCCFFLKRKSIKVGKIYQTFKAGGKRSGGEHFAAAFSPFEMATHEPQRVVVGRRHVEHQTLETVHLVHVVRHLCKTNQQTCRIINKCLFLKFSSIRLTDLFLGQLATSEKLN